MKSHFRFSRKQRNGIFLLIVLIVAIQAVLLFANSNSSVPSFEDEELKNWRNELDSLAKLESKKENKLFPFNPNYITDYKGYVLGMSIDQIDALHAYRAKGEWINSKEDFKRVTGVSQEWLDSISPFFKFPDWVTKKQSVSKSPRTDTKLPKTYDDKIDLNKATAIQLQKIYGIGPALSERIIKYRESFEFGFVDDIELTEVYGLDAELIQRIQAEFTVKTPRPINKVNINEASSEELVTIPYIDYEIAYNIIEYRTLHEGISTIEELTKIEDFPEKKIKLIELYLQF